MTVSPSGLKDAAHKQTTHPLGEAMDVCWRTLLHPCTCCSFEPTMCSAPVLHICRSVMIPFRGLVASGNCWREGQYVRWTKVNFKVLHAAPVQGSHGAFWLAKSSVVVHFWSRHYMGVWTFAFVEFNSTPNTLKKPEQNSGRDVWSEYLMFLHHS